MKISSSARTADFLILLSLHCRQVILSTWGALQVGTGGFALCTGSQIEADNAKHSATYCSIEASSNLAQCRLPRACGDFAPGCSCMQLPAAGGGRTLRLYFSDCTAVCSVFSPAFRRLVPLLRLLGCAGFCRVCNFSSSRSRT